MRRRDFFKALAALPLLGLKKAAPKQPETPLMRKTVNPIYKQADGSLISWTYDTDQNIVAWEDNPRVER
jgi:hypothetical protein